MRRGLGGWRETAGGVLVSAGLVAGCSLFVPDAVAPPAPDGAVESQRTGGSPVTPAATAGPAADAFEPVVDADLLDLGGRLTEALQAGDVETWLALHALDEEGTDQQRDWFAAVQAVPMDVREMHPVSMIVTDAPGEHTGPIVEFGFRHQVTGADPVPSVEYYRLTVGRDAADGALEVVEVDGSSASRTAYPQLWDLAPVTVLEGEAVVVLAEARSQERALDLMPSLDLAAQEVLSDLPVEGVDTMVVTLADQDLVASLFGGSEVGEFAGFTVSVAGSSEVAGAGLVDLETTEDATARIVLETDYTWQEWDYYGGDLAGGAPLLRHEGLHLAMVLHEPGGWPPAWVEEGLAGWYEVAGDELSREDQLWWYDLVLEDYGPPEGIPPAAHKDFLVRGDEELVERYYADSAMVFWYVEETYGRDAALALGRALHEVPYWTEQDEVTEDALQEHLGVGTEEFEADWVAWAGEILAPGAGGD